MTILANVVVAVAIFVAALAFARWRRRRAGRGSVGDYQLRAEGLFTQGERAFLAALKGSLPPGVRLFGKVRLADIFTPSGQVPEGDRRRAFWRISQKHVDFLLVREDDLTPLAGVELDDRSHEAFERRERDAFVDSVFASGGLPLLHFQAQAYYDRSSIRARLGEALR